MFIEILTSLMKENGINRHELSVQSGIPYTTICGFYSKGADNVKLSTLTKLAEFFDVSLDYLLGKSEQRKPLVNGDEELSDYLEELKSRSEMRMLFSVGKNCTKEEVEQAVRIIEALRKGENN